MENAELIVPSTRSHWSLKLVETQKPFPNHILANVTYKILRFFYPPFALDVVDLTHVVSNPELNAFNVGIFLSLSLVLLCAIYAGCKLFRKEKTAVRKSTDQQARFKNEAELAGSLDLPTNVLMEPKWMTESNDSLFDPCFGKENKENDVRCRTKIDTDEDKQDDLEEQIDRAVWERAVPKKQPKP